jgi:chemotaxis response regulator CheB
MCRALRVLCAASDPEGLAALKRATVSASWEVVGGATSVEELGRQIEGWAPDVVVVDAALGHRAVATVRSLDRPVRLVSVGPLAGTDAAADSLGSVREAIVGIPGPGGPVRA